MITSSMRLKQMATSSVSVGVVFIECTGALMWLPCRLCSRFFASTLLTLGHQTTDVLAARLSCTGQLNVMAHAQKPDFVFRWNGLLHLNRRGRQFSRLLATDVCASAFIVGSNAGYIMFWGSVKGTGYPLHSPVSPSLPLPCVTVCLHISTGVYIHMA